MSGGVWAREHILARGKRACTETRSQARAVPLPDRREATWKGREHQGLENELRPREGMAWGWIGQGVWRKLDCAPVHPGPLCSRLAWGPRSLLPVSQFYEPVLAELALRVTRASCLAQIPAQMEQRE